jgi:hypothetical protein
MRYALEKILSFFELFALGLVFFAIVLPLAIFFRFRGRDPLSRKFNGTQESYWIECVQAELVPKSFYEQFIEK